MGKITISRETKIGIVVVVAIAMLYFGLNYLKGINIFQSTTYYYAQYDRVDGIVPTTPVMINGFQVGHVSEIFFDYTKEAPITLQITVDKKLVVPQGTVAQVYDNGLMGGKAIQLQLGTGNTLMQPGDTLIASVQNGLMDAVTSALIEPIKAMMPQLDSTLTAVKEIMQSQQIQAILAHTAQATKELEAASANLNGLMANDIQVAVKDIKNIAANFSAISNEMQAVQWDSTLMNIESAIANLEATTNKLKSNDNTLGALLNDNALYQNLDSTVQSANALLIDLKANPKRYVHFSVFGSKEKNENDSKK
ncbi:MAG: MCE family protein [Paludibacteraceae bacterium]|jgi:phospholipid/cholesterol/gamma-HCH transport system substrate-binding protein|nr:MCE family protein [Paludibacteraceae bacterium]MED9996076.1 MlaD family protein [Paludibacteraceae bacterium]